MFEIVNIINFYFGSISFYFFSCFLVNYFDISFAPSNLSFS